MGPTIFILPKVFATAGYVNASIGIILISVLYAYNLHSLLNSAAVVQNVEGRTNLSFAETVKYAFEKGEIGLNLKNWAPLMYQLMNVLFVVSWGGELSFTIVFLANSLQDLFGSWGDAINIQWFISALFVPCVLLTLIPCGKLSFLGAVTALIDIAFVLVVMYDLYYSFDVSWFAHCEAFRPFEDIPQFLATVFFTLNFTGLAIPSRNLMRRPEKFDSTFGVLHISLLIITCANIVFGFSGYLRYGQKVHESLILNLPLDSTLLRISLALYCLATFFSFPFLYFVLFNVVWEEWVMKLCENARKYDRLGYKILTSICTNVAVFVIVLWVPNLNLFTNLGGLVCGVMDSFVIPAILEIILYAKNNSTNNFYFVLVKNIIIVLLGLVLFAFGLRACANMTTNSYTGS